jgi:hypothetical protein
LNRDPFLDKDLGAPDPSWGYEALLKKNSVEDRTSSDFLGLLSDETMRKFLEWCDRPNKVWMKT